MVSHLKIKSFSVLIVFHDFQLLLIIYELGSEAKKVQWHSRDTLLKGFTDRESGVVRVSRQRWLGMLSK